MNTNALPCYAIFPFCLQYNFVQRLNNDGLSRPLHLYLLCHNAEALYTPTSALQLLFILPLDFIRYCTSVAWFLIQI